MYSLLRNILFKLDPEKAHHFTLNMVHFIYKTGLLQPFSAKIDAPCEVMGLKFKNPIGLSAGLDNNADYIEALGALGFGFIEVGGVTPKAQTGNPKPRLFRLPKYEALINRMGFDNKGADYLALQLANTKYKGIIGINIGKNRDTPLEKAIDDYHYCFDVLAPYASYFTINVSSPNTPGLRQLQQAENLNPLLKSLKEKQQAYKNEKGKYIPLVVKISPDLEPNEVAAIAGVLLDNEIDGITAGNTTIDRSAISGEKLAHETGGLSGRPLSHRNTQMIRRLHELLKGRIPIIGVGGVMDAQTAKDKLDAGASLLQVYTGFIYKGPALLQELKTVVS